MVGKDGAGYCGWRGVLLGGIFINRLPERVREPHGSNRGCWLELLAPVDVGLACESVRLPFHLSPLTAASASKPSMPSEMALAMSAINLPWLDPEVMR